MKKIAIIGAGGHGKMAAEVAGINGYEEIVFFDDAPDCMNCMGYPVVKGVKNISEFPEYEVFVAIGNVMFRKRIMEELLRQDRLIATLIHPTSTISKSAEIGIGSIIMPGAVINVETKIGKGCIINTCSSVDHENVLEDYVHISVGTHLSGNVHIGESTWVGAGAVVNNNVHVCKHCTIGAGAIVVRNIDVSGTYVGVPARQIK